MSLENANSQDIRGEYWPLGNRIPMLIRAVQRRLSLVQPQHCVMNRDANISYSLQNLFDSYDLDYVRDNMHLLADRFARYAANLEVDKKNGIQSVQSESIGFFQSPEFRGKYNQ